MTEERVRARGGRGGGVAVLGGFVKQGVNASTAGACSEQGCSQE
ncbi:hypothetical protein ACFWMV_26820 [Streptomyces mutabilis]